MIILLIFVSFIFPNIAGGAEWVFISENNSGDKFYVDKESI